MKRKDIKELGEISRYNLDNIFDVHKDENGIYFYNLYNSVYFDDNISTSLYTEHIFSEGDTWTTLSYKYYKTVELYWIILAANNIQNPLNLPDSGTKLKILKDFVVSDILSSKILR